MGPQLTMKHVAVEEELRAYARVLPRKDDGEAQDRTGEWACRQRVSEVRPARL